MNSNPSTYQNTLLLLILITAVAVDISIPILPSITDYFNIERGQSQYIISSFLAGYGLSMIPIGLLSDRYGRLPVMYIGLVIYLIAGLVIVFAPSFEILLWGRFFQGIGGGVGPVNARAIARDMTSGKKLAKLMSSLTAALFLAPIFAPILGSQLYHFWTWQIAFLVPPVLGLFLLISVWFTAYETIPQKNTNHPIRKQFSESIQSFLTSRDSIWALLIILTSFSGYQIILASTSFLMTEIYEMETKMVGTVFGLTAILMIAATIYNKGKSQSTSSKKLLGYGIALSLFASLGWIFCSFFEDLPFWFVWIFFSIYVTAIGFILPNTSTIALEPLSNIAGFASSVFGAGMILGSAIATAIAANFYTGSLSSITGGVIFCSVLSAVIFYMGINFQKQKS